MIKKSIQSLLIQPKSTDKSININYRSFGPTPAPPAGKNVQITSTPLGLPSGCPSNNPTVPRKTLKRKRQTSKSMTHPNHIQSPIDTNNNDTASMVTSSQQVPMTSSSLPDTYDGIQQYSGGNKRYLITRSQLGQPLNVSLGGASSAVQHISVIHAACKQHPPTSTVCDFRASGDEYPTELAMANRALKQMSLVCVCLFLKYQFCVD